MATRKKTTKATETKTAKRSATDTVEGRVIAFAEQLGRVVGTVQARTDGWLDRETLNDQLTRIRDGATGLLNHLGSVAASAAAVTTGRKRSKATSAKAKPAARTTGRSGGKVDAPGKTHRKAPPVARSVKHSDEMIPKMKSAIVARRRPRG